jgi:Site-specific recombinase XerD
MSEKKNPNGAGYLYKENGMWVMQITLGRNSNGKLRKVSWRTQKQSDVRRWSDLMGHAFELYKAEKTSQEIFLEIQNYMAEVNIKNEAIKKLIKIGLMEDRTHTTEQSKSPVFVDYLIDHVKSNYMPPLAKETTYSSYLERIYASIAPYFLQTRLDELNTKKLQKFYQHLSTNGRKDGKGGLSPKTVHNIHFIINPCLEAAAEAGDIEENYARKAKRAQVVTPETRYLSDGENELFLDAVLMENRRVLILTYYLTGLRLGELLPLEISDFAVDRKTLKLNKNYTRIQVFDDPKQKTKLILQKSTKSKKNREIPIADELAFLLQLHISEMERSGVPNPLNLLFPSNAGTRIDPRTVQRTLAAVSKKSGIARVNPHALRHTFATRLDKQKVSISTIQELLGHANVQTTRRYIHVKEQTTAAVATLTAEMGEFFQNLLPNPHQYTA